jgi:hypothetical protein
MRIFDWHHQFLQNFRQIPNRKTPLAPCPYSRNTEANVASLYSPFTSYIHTHTHIFIVFCKRESSKIQECFHSLPKGFQNLHPCKESGVCIRARIIFCSCLQALQSAQHIPTHRHQLPYIELQLCFHFRAPQPSSNF